MEEIGVGRVECGESGVWGENEQRWEADMGIEKGGEGGQVRKKKCAHV